MSLTDLMGEAVEDSLAGRAPEPEDPHADEARAEAAGPATPAPVPWAHLPPAFRRPLLTAADIAVFNPWVTNLATVPWMPVSWRWGSAKPLPDGTTLQLVPNGELCVIVAEGGTGKGMLCAAYIGAETTGRPFPMMPADMWRPPADIIYIAPEDNQVTTIVPRMLAAGADAARVHDLTWLPDGSRLRLPGNLPQLLAAINAFYTPRALAAGANLAGVIIDPIGAAVDEQMSTVRQARAVLEPLMAIAARYNYPVIATHHTNWDGGINGSAAIRNVPRILWMLERDPDDDDIRVLSLTGSRNKGKANIASRNQTYRFTVAESVPGEPVTARAVFESRLSARERMMGPVMAAARAYQLNNAYQITAVPARHVIAGTPHAAAITASPLDQAASALCAQVGGNWDDAAQQANFRVMARAALQAGRP